MKQILQTLNSSNQELKQSLDSFPGSTSSSSQIVRKQIFTIYSHLYINDPLRKSNRFNFKDPNTQYHSDMNLNKMLEELTEIISKQNNLLSLKALKQCLIIMKKVKENDNTQNYSLHTLKQLEQRYYFLHDNYFVFEKKFKESIVVLRSFSALNYKLSNKKYLNQWYKYALDNLKFFTAPEICDILFITAFQLPEKKDIYDTIKLQLFKPTPLYYQELLKAKLAVNPKEFKTVIDLIKTTISKLVLSSYQRKGLYWGKEFDFRLSDTVKLLQSYVLKEENNGAYLALLVQILRKNLFTSIKDGSDVFKNQKSFLKLLPILVNLSEKERKHLGEKFNALLDIEISFLINILPGANIHRVLAISESFNALCQHSNNKSGFEVCKLQILELLEDNLNLVEDKNVLLGISNIFINCFRNLAPVYVSENRDSKEGGERFRNILVSFVEKLEQVVQELLIQQTENLLLINSLLQKTSFEGEGFDRLRRKIVETSFTDSAYSTSLALEFLECFSLINFNNNKLSTHALNNFASFVNYLYQKLEVKSLNQEFVERFFKILLNLGKHNHLPVLLDESREKLDKVQKSLLRYLADHYQEFPISMLEQILSHCLEGGFLEIDFDDGSGLYAQNIIQETHGHVTKHLKEFSADFQNKIAPYLEKYQEASALETLAENIKNLSL